MKRQKYPALTLRGNSYEIAERVPGERKIIAGKINIDYGCFRKTPEERRKLRIAKLSANQ